MAKRRCKNAGRKIQKKRRRQMETEYDLYSDVFIDRIPVF